MEMTRATICACSIHVVATAPTKSVAQKMQRTSTGKANKIYGWYLDVCRRLTGVPRFVINDAQYIYRKVLKEAGRKGCTEQGASFHMPYQTSLTTIAHRFVLARCRGRIVAGFT